MGVVTAVTFTLCLVTLVIIPRQARRTAAAISPEAAVRPDTQATAAAFANAQRQIAAADSKIGAARAEAARQLAANAAVRSADSTAGVVTLSAPVRSHRDSLASQVALIGRLILRSENAPLLSSYRALAQATPMQGDPRVKLLLDSLVEIERERDSYSAVGGVDPVFVALTARANELGRSIETLADAKRAAIRSEMTALAPPLPVASVSITTRSPRDTLEQVNVRDAERVIAVRIAGQLAQERAELLRLDERAERARELANVGASPGAIVAASLVFGAMLGFGVALFYEVRHPRIADAYEVERATGVRVLGIINPLSPSSERGRRTAERTGPLFIDPGADGHQLIYQSIVTAGTGTVSLSIAGDSPAVSAMVAINFAAIAADEARATLLIDTDAVSSSLVGALHLRPGPGISELARGDAMWGEVTRTVQLGRDRTIDVVTSGDSGPTADDIAALLHRDASRISRQYDAVIVLSGWAQVRDGVAASLPVPDVLYCARVGVTPLAELTHAIEEIAKSGAQVRGIVIWNMEHPKMPALKRADEVQKEMVAA